MTDGLEIRSCGIRFPSPNLLHRLVSAMATPAQAKLTEQHNAPRQKKSHDYSWLLFYLLLRGGPTLGTALKPAALAIGWGVTYRTRLFPSR